MILQWEQFVDYLLSQKSPTLIIAGDFFDFWISYRDLIRTEYLPILSQFKRLTDADVSLVYVRGNHDFMSMDLLHALYGVTVVDHQYRLSLNWGDALIEHGDRLRFSVKHSLVNRVLWSPISHFLYRLIPANWAIALALKVAHVSRKRNSVKCQDGTTSSLYKELLEKRDAFDGVKLSIIGHVHHSALETSGDGWIYANPGTWLKAPTFLCVTDEAVSLHELESSSTASLLKQVQIQ